MSSLLSLVSTVLTYALKNMNVSYMLEPLASHPPHLPHLYELTLHDVNNFSKLKDILLARKKISNAASINCLTFPTRMEDITDLYEVEEIVLSLYKVHKLVA